MLPLRRLSVASIQVSRHPRRPLWIGWNSAATLFPATTATVKNNDDMKFCTLVTTAALVAPARGFVQQTPPHKRLLAVSSRLLATVASPSSLPGSSSSSLEEKNASTNVDDDTVIAVGTVVAQYPGGGFSAVQIQDDDNETGGDLLGKHVILPGANGHMGMVVAHRPPLIFCYHHDSSSQNDATTPTVPEGKVQVLHSLAKVSAAVAPRVDAYGRPMNGKDHSDHGRAIFSPIPQVRDIALINSPVLTGITMVDALAPLGRGQNMLWVTHDVANSVRPYLLDWIGQHLSSNDKEKDVATTPVIYAALDTDEATLAQLPSQVQVVARSTTASTDPVVRAAEGVAMAGSACALAEQHAMQGKHALVVIDTMDGHKALWDATTRVLVDVFGIEAVVQGDRDGGASSEMRAFYSSLIQRSAQYKASRGGGSVTILLVTCIPEAANADGDVIFSPQDFSSAPAKVQERIQLLVQKKIPLTEANLRKLQIPIPSDAEGRRRLVLQHTDDLISMSDGQIWFDEDLQKAGQWPPMDPQRSVTRIGIGADTPSRADAPALRKVVEGLRLVLSQAKDNLEGVAQSCANATRKQILRQRALLLVLHQEPGTGVRRLSESCGLLLAASQGLLDDAVADDSLVAGSSAGAEIVSSVLEHLGNTIPEVMSEIDDTLDLTDNNKAAMLETLKRHLA